MLIFNLYFINI